MFHIVEILGLGVPVAAGAGRHGGGSSGHSIEYWIAVLAGLGVMGSGWSCVALRVLNSICGAASEEDTRAWWEAQRLQGALTAFDATRFWLWEQFGLGGWQAERLKLSEWSAAGALAGTTIAFILFGGQA